MPDTTLNARVSRTESLLLQFTPSEEYQCQYNFFKSDGIQDGVAGMRTLWLEILYKAMSYDFERFFSLDALFILEVGNSLTILQMNPRNSWK